MILRSLARLCLLVIVMGAALVAPSYAQSQRPAEFPTFTRLAGGSKPEKLQEFLAQRPGYDVNYPFSEVTRQTAVFPLAYGGKVEAVGILIAHGLKVDYIEAGGATALHTAIRSSKIPESLRIATMLLDAGANPNLTTPDGPTPFMIAAIWGREDIMRLLIERGVDPKAAGPTGAGALDALETSYVSGPLRGKQALYDRTKAFLVERGVVTMATYRDSATAVANTAAGRQENAQRVSEGIDRITGAIFDKAKGTGRRCFHRLIVANFAGAGLSMSMMGQLESGRWTEISENNDGRFRVLPSGITPHPIWLVQGGTYLLGAKSDRGGSWFDGFQFDVPNTCDDRPNNAVTIRQFIVELDNQRSRLVISEDKNRDGRPDADAAATRVAQDSASSACANLLPLATEIKPDNTALMFNDEQLDQLLSSAGCTLPDRTKQQRTRLTELLARPN